MRLLLRLLLRLRLLRRRQRLLRLRLRLRLRVRLRGCYCSDGVEVATEVVTACVLVGTAATPSSLHAHYTPTTPTTPAMFAAPTTTRSAAPGRKWSSSAGGRSGGISGKGSGGSGDGDRERGSWLELEIVIATARRCRQP